MQSESAGKAKTQDSPPNSTPLATAVQEIHALLSHAFHGAHDDEDANQRALWMTAMKLSSVSLSSKILSTISSIIINSLGVAPDDSVVEAILAVLTGFNEGVLRWVTTFLRDRTLLTAICQPKTSTSLSSARCSYVSSYQQAIEYV